MSPCKVITWLSFHTQEEIAEKENLAKSQVNEICSEMADLPKLNKSDQLAASHLVDFEAPDRAFQEGRHFLIRIRSHPPRATRQLCYPCTS